MLEKGEIFLTKNLQPMSVKKKKRELKPLSEHHKNNRYRQVQPMNVRTGW